MAINKIGLYAAILIFTVVAPFIFPNYGVQLATLWLMIIVAMTWDMTGGQMGYNSLGNIFFYGTGMYVAAVITISLAYNVGEYTSAAGGGITKEFAPAAVEAGCVVVDNSSAYRQDPDTPLVVPEINGALKAVRERKMR